MNNYLLLSLMTGALSISSFAVETVKVFDGTSVECKSDNDVYRNRKGIYKAKALKSKTVGQEVELTIKLEFFACVKTSEGFKLKHIDPYENTEYQAYSVDDGKHSVNVLPINGNFKIFQDGVFKLIEQKDLAFKAVQNHVVKIDLEDLRNMPNIDLQVTKEVILDSDRFQVMSTIRYGSYRVHFEVKDANAELKK
jgi:hypothetical protein